MKSVSPLHSPVEELQKIILITSETLKTTGTEWGMEPFNKNRHKTLL